MKKYRSSLGSLSADSGCDSAFTVEQMAGANLSGQQLPEQFKSFEYVSVAKALGDHATKIYAGMVSLALYCLLVMLTTSDDQILASSLQVKLPILGIDMALRDLYRYAPPVIAVLFAYIEFQVAKTCIVLFKLPAIFPDGARVDERCDLWLLGGHLRAKWPILRNGNGLWRLFILASSLVRWVPPWLCVYIFWARALRMNDWITTWAHLIVMGFMWTPLLLWLMDDRPSARGAEGRVAVIADPRYRRFGGWLIMTSLFVAFHFVLSWGIFATDTMGGAGDESKLGLVFSPKCWGARWIGFFGVRSYYNVSGQSISRSKDALGGIANLDLPLDHIEGAPLSLRSLRFIAAQESMLAKSDFSGDELTGAVFYKADLRYARFNGAYLVSADFRECDLKGADFTGADISTANFSGAKTSLAKFEKVIATNANFAGVKDLNPEMAATLRSVGAVNVRIRWPRNNNETDPDWE